MNRYKYLDGRFIKPPIKEIPKGGIVENMDALVAHGRNLVRAGYNYIYIEDLPKDHLVGYLFRKPYNETPDILLQTPFPQAGRWSDYFNDENRRLGFITEVLLNV